MYKRQVFGCAPFFTRQIESALADVDPGLIEAAQSMGLDNKDIIFRVYLKESIAGIARGTTITIISLIGLTAMAGAIGAGGLGNFAIMYGHQRNMPDITYTTAVSYTHLWRRQWFRCRGQSVDPSGSR